MENKLFLPFLGLCLTSWVYGQNTAIGSWQAHLTYFNVNQVVTTNERVYASAGNGIFYIEKADNSIKTLSTVDGLSDTEATAMGFHTTRRTLIIGYANGNIDLVTPNQIINIRTLFNNQNFEQKRINHISIRQDFAYLSTPFGIVVLDISRNLIRETYAYLGEKGALIAINATAFWADSIWASTSEGIKAASMATNISKMDFNNWKTVIKNSKIDNIVVRNNKLYYAVENEGVYEYHAGQVTALNLPLAFRYGLSTSANNLLVTANNTIFRLNDNNTIVNSLTNNILIEAKEAYQETDGTIWIADLQAGLIRYRANTFEQFLLSGTFSKSVYRLINAGNKIIAVSGGIQQGRDTALNSPLGFDVYENGKWTNYSAVPNQRLSVYAPELIDVNDAAYDASANVIYLASFRRGLITWDLAKNTFTAYDTFPLIRTQNQTRIASVGVDAQGTVWVSNQVSSRFNPTLHSRSKNGEWTSYNFGNNAMYVNPRDIFVDRFNNKWIIQKPAVQTPVDSTVGVLAVRDGQTFRGLNNINAGIKAPVNAVTQDLDNVMWFGTNSGLVILRDFNRLYTNQPLETAFPRYDGLQLLRDQTVTSIAVDGGNRKWVGTAEDGVWLFDKGTNAPTLHFTTQNSPLFANYIIDIAIHPTTGEVFFATEKGILSYRSDATVASKKQETDVRVFPNPVRPDYNGIVTITDLVRDALIKITDVSGKLVWQTQAIGGTATWNMNTLAGEKAQTGVYFVFSTDAEQGTETFVTKIAIIR